MLHAVHLAESSSSGAPPEQAGQWADARLATPPIASQARAPCLTRHGGRAPRWCAPVGRAGAGFGDEPRGDQGESW
ncbi:hypothetical protein STRIP9103_05817 [Streptomyces ipomoeae 91-03]|uniref:Uncharacterized protein n=1 Tax=Streptomyces ipomoeae 91-03 TaxID=698759 RepID=L1L2X0_9ACTN|nr:hypothetical protein STRIP9103_05817 [Streptomyces ipomoeae 91-03]